MFVATSASLPVASFTKLTVPCVNVNLILMITDKEQNEPAKSNEGGRS